jgi:two-component system, sensor histidine kinase
MEETKILVVEDEEITAMDIRSRLLELGYNVPATANSGQEAISLTEKFKPDLILMDIVLKDQMDGITAAQYITTRYNVPIIYLTAYSDDETIDRAKISAPYGYITKPFETKGLQIAIIIALCKRNLEIKSEIEANRLKNEYLSNITDQIRTPLNAIIGFTELLHSNEVGTASPAQKDLLKNILSNSQILLQLLDDILKHSQAQT